MARKGFTLIETLIALAIFVIVAGGVYLSYNNVFDITIASQLNSTGLTVIANELEVIRNIKYSDIGTQGGAPAGIIPPVKNINFSGFNFVLNTTVRNVDDPFDSVLGGVPNDTAPADYKIIEFELLCTNCPRFIPIRTTTTVAPANLESVSQNGNVFVNVIDASGQPVTQANVTVINNTVNPPININDVTNNNGQLQLVDIATSSIGYQITVAKSGYSTDRTYQPGLPANPNPVKPHATVVEQQLTILSFAVDLLSAQTLNTRNKFCQPVGNIDFNQQGTKMIGTGPDVLKYSVNDLTSAGGTKVTNIEWDTYNLQNTDTVYDLAGTSLVSPFDVNPNSPHTLNWQMETKNGSSLLVVAQDDDGQFVDGASISLTKVGFSETKVSAHNYFSQTDWSGGQFNQKSSNIEEASPAGEIHLRDLGGGKYASLSLEWLESATFDMGTTANFYKLKWNPLSQPAQTGIDSLKLQLATNNNNSTWNYVGPDGTSGTYYANPNSATHGSHNGNRYFRYRVYLSTEDHNWTPGLEDMNVEFSSSCLSSGQSFFSGLTNNTYTLTIQKAGFQTYTAQVDIGAGWQEHKATLIP